MRLIDISKDLNPKFFEDVEKGQVIGFEKDGITTHYKVVRLNKSKRICKVQPIKLYTEEEINEMPREQAEEIISGKS
jgi:hypothetical protein